MHPAQEQHLLNFRGHHTFCIDRQSVYAADRPGEPCHYIGELNDLIASRSLLGEEFRIWWNNMREQAALDNASEDLFTPRRLRVVR